jgi:hypothetical protein
LLVVALALGTLAGCKSSSASGTGDSLCQGAVTVTGVSFPSGASDWDSCLVQVTGDGGFSIGLAAHTCPADGVCLVSVIVPGAGEQHCDVAGTSVSVSDPTFAGPHEFGAGCSGDCPAMAIGSCTVNSTRVDLNGWAGTVDAQVVDSDDLTVSAHVTVSGSFANPL